MASPVFDKKQYELRGHTPEVLTGQQKSVLNSVIARVNGQLDWNAQFLGFNGPNYWGKRIPTQDGSYKWRGLPETVSEKRAIQVGAFGVYNKDKPYEERPAPFNRAEVRASADLILTIFEENNKTLVIPRGLPRELLYEKTPRLIAGGEYTFDQLVQVEAPSGNNDSFFVTQDLAQNITAVRILDDSSEAISVKLEGSNAEPFLFFIEKWEDPSDWTSEQLLAQFLGIWGNKGNAIASHFFFDALDIHGFNEEEGLSLDTIVESISIKDLLGLIGLKPGPGSPRITTHYNFTTSDCSDFYKPSVELDSEFARLQTENFEALLTESGEEIVGENGACADVIPPFPLSTNNEDPEFNDLRIFSEQLDEINTDNTTADYRGCFTPPDAKFGECDSPNYVLTFRQFFSEDTTGIATDPGPENSVPIGANGVKFLSPLTCFIDNGEYESILGPFFLDGGNFDEPLVFTDSVSDGLYNRDPLSVCDVVLEDFERTIEGDDLVIDVGGEPGPVLMTDVGIENEIEIAASGGDYDGFVIGFDGIELETLSFEYEAKTTYGEVRFPCVEWIFDPTLDNSTYFPVPDEAPWAGADDGEFDREPKPVSIAIQTFEECSKGNFLSFDDGIFDEIISPNCDYEDLIVENCQSVDGEFYQLGINPLVPPDSNTVCGVECGTVDHGVYVHNQAPFTLATIDGGSIDSCTIYDNLEYDLVQSPGAIADCIAYNNGSYAGGTLSSQIDCVIQDKDNFVGGQYPLPPIDDGFYLTSTIIETISLSTESNLELLLESGETLGIDPAIIFPVTSPPSCAPCTTDETEFQALDCLLDNGDFEGPFPATINADDGLFDRDLGPFCVPCQAPDTPVIPCPVDPIRVRLDQLIFSAPRWRMRPTVINSKTPLRLWKNRTLNVSDLSSSTAFSNPLIADQNSGPEDPNQFRHFARLPAEYSRDGKFWNRTQSVLANQSYFSRALPPSKTKIDPVDQKPLLYDETYFQAEATFNDSSIFYVEDYLISSIREDQQITEDGFIGAKQSFEKPNTVKPFVSSATIEYDGYDQRKLSPTAERSGSYLKFSRRDKRLTGFLETDVNSAALRFTTDSEFQFNDTNNLLIPNIAFPDDPSEASFANYVVSYAYFAADMSAADEPVFDPTALFNHRNKRICIFELDVEQLAAENSSIILTEEFESFNIGEKSEIVKKPLLTFSKYIFHEDEIPPCEEVVEFECIGKIE